MSKTTILQSVADEYFETKNTNERYWRELQARFNTEIVPFLGRYKLISHITKADLKKLLATKDRYPAAKRTMWDGLRPFFKYCVCEDYISTSPMDTMMPPPAPLSRDRILSIDEIKLVWKHTETGYFSPFYRLLLLTGQRRQEVAGIRSNEIQGAVWVIPKERTKSNRATAVPLSTVALQEIEKAKFINKGLSGFSKSKYQLDKLVGFSDWRIHDLRRTCGSYLGLLGVPENIIDRILNHKPQGLRGRYNLYQYLPEKTHALKKLSDFIISLTKD